MNLAIILRLRNQDELDDFLKEVDNPSSPVFRQFLTVAQFTDRFGPTVADYQAVVDWAKSSGFTVGNAPANRLVVDISGTAAQVEEAFNLSLNVYQHPDENRTFFAPDREPTVDLSVPLWHIAGLDNYSIPRPADLGQGDAMQPLLATGSGPGASYLASDMRGAYYGGSTLTGAGQSVGLVEFQGYDIGDVTSTLAPPRSPNTATSSINGNNYTLTYTTYGQPYTIQITNSLLDGATVSPNPLYGGEGEVVLDIAQAIGMAPGLSQVVVYIAPTLDLPQYSGDGDVDILNQMVSDNIAKQLSMSWGWTPCDLGEDDQFFDEMQSQGQTFFAATGDSGSWPYTNGKYYPSEDPRVTSVGGTALATNGAGGSWASEAGWPGSSGGISPDGLAIQPWQTGIQDSCTQCSNSFRNAPDVSMEANGDNYSCEMGACAGNHGGTSFAAPRWAGFMALVNQQAVNDGLAPHGGLGFINPSLYAIGMGSNYNSDFHDIPPGVSNGAYQTAMGYDLVTGWGSPEWSQLHSRPGAIAAAAHGGHSIRVECKRPTERNASDIYRLLCDLSGCDAGGDHPLPGNYLQQPLRMGDDIRGIPGGFLQPLSEHLAFRNHVRHGAWLPGELVHRSLFLRAASS
jgi:subtilase family serine protease